MTIEEQEFVKWCDEVPQKNWELNQIVPQILYPLWLSNRALEAKVNKTNHELIRIAAELVTWKGLPSYYVSEHPARASRQYWQEVMGKIDTRIKDWAIQIKFIVEQSKEKP
jgi:hypothetical protein